MDRLIALFPVCLINLVSGNPVQPGFEALRILQVVEIAKGPQKHILREIFCILAAINHLIDKTEDAPGIYNVDLPASIQIPCASTANDFMDIAIQ
jgi:hypothetical protein